MVRAAVSPRCGRPPVLGTRQSLLRVGRTVGWRTEKGVKLAIISDVHGNLEALETVLDDIAKRGIPLESTLSLGDMVGYGPNPRECLRKAMELKLTLMGNHEEALLYYPEDFNEKARQAIDWTKEQLNAPDQDRELNYKLWNFLDSMPRSAPLSRQATLVHASPRMPTREYVMPRDITNPDRMRAIFAHQKTPVCFCGHTHFPGVFSEKLTFQSPKELDNRYVVGKEMVLINVGSVGQPRDGDPRACYVTYDGETIEYHRLEYNLATTQKKIAQIEALPNFLAARLAKGR